MSSRATRSVVTASVIESSWLLMQRRRTVALVMSCLTQRAAAMTASRRGYFATWALSRSTPPPPSVSVCHFLSKPAPPPPASQFIMTSSSRQEHQQQGGETTDSGNKPDSQQQQRPVGSGSTTGRDIGHAALGIAVFVVTDRVIAYLLTSAHIHCPSSVVCIILFGVLSASNRSGAVLFRCIGPGAMWLRAILPICLAGGLLSPVSSLASSSNALAGVDGFRVVCLLACDMILTVCLVGTVLRLGLRVFATKEPIGMSPPSVVVGETVVATSRGVMRAQQYAAKALRSMKIGIACLVVGSALSWWWDSRVPFHCAMTSAFLISANRFTPRKLSLVMPPMITCGAAVATTLYAVGGMTEIDSYVHGAMRFGFSLVSPAMGTLGLYVHTHRSLLMRTGKPLSMVCLICAPVGLLTGACVGTYVLGLPSNIVSSTLPATTTLGLALAMTPTLSREFHAEKDLVILGPVFCGVTGMLTWPLLLRFAGLSSVTAAAAAGTSSLSPEFVKGFALGGASHISVMTALQGSGHQAAADAAAMAFFLLGTTRAIFVEMPWFQSLLGWCLGK